MNTADIRDRSRDRAARDGFVADHCRPATVYDYRTWLLGHLDCAGRVTHSYDYDLPTTWEVLVSADADLPSLYGALALHVLVPTGHRLHVPNTFHGHAGHNNVFYMDGFRAAPEEWVPIYRDVAALGGVLR